MNKEQLEQLLAMTRLTPTTPEMDKETDEIVNQIFEGAEEEIEAEEIPEGIENSKGFMGFLERLFKV